MAEEELGIPALLDAEDMVALKVPDRLSILTYVSQYYNYFHGRSPIGGMGGIKRPAVASVDEPSGKKNQPVTPKMFPSSKPARENSRPPSTNITRPISSRIESQNSTQDIPAERLHQMGTLSNKCVSCNKHVHLVQRHLIDGKLYHRSCAKSLLSTAPTAPLRDLPTNTQVSRFSPLPTSSNTNTPTPAQSPSRLGATWLPDKPNTSNVSTTFSSLSSSRTTSGLSTTPKQSPIDRSQKSTSASSFNVTVTEPASAFISTSKEGCTDKSHNPLSVSRVASFQSPSKSTTNNSSTVKETLTGKSHNLSSDFSPFTSSTTTSGLLPSSTKTLTHKPQSTPSLSTLVSSLSSSQPASGLSSSATERLSEKIGDPPSASNTSYLSPYQPSSRFYSTPKEGSGDESHSSASSSSKPVSGISSAAKESSSNKSGNSPRTSIIFSSSAPSKPPSSFSLTEKKSPTDVVHNYSSTSTVVSPLPPSPPVSRLFSTPKERLLEKPVYPPHVSSNLSLSQPSSKFSSTTKEHSPDKSAHKVSSVLSSLTSTRPTPSTKESLTDKPSHTSSISTAKKHSTDKSSALLKVSSNLSNLSSPKSDTSLASPAKENLNEKSVNPSKVFTVSRSLSPSRPSTALSSDSKESVTDKHSVTLNIPGTFSTSSSTPLISGLSSAVKESPSSLVSKPTPLTDTTTVSTTPVAAPRSKTAEKTVQSKLKFFQSDNSQEKKTSTVNIDLFKSSNVNKNIQGASVGQAVSVFVNIGDIEKTEVNDSWNKTQDQSVAPGRSEKSSLKQEDDETKKAKSSAAAFISKKLAEERNSNKSKTTGTPASLKKTDNAQPQTEKPKETLGVRGRVRLKADPSILSDLHLPNLPSSTSPSRGGHRVKTPDRGGPKPGSESLSTSESGNNSPADWRQKLKPVSKDTKPVAHPQSSPRLPPRAVGRSSELPSSSPIPSVSVTPPMQKDSLHVQKTQTAKDTKAQSKVSKMKPDYIPKEDIIKELQEIEDNLNDLEKRGVELEVKLRSCEEDGEDDSLMDELMVEWFLLIRNKQVAMRRESELVYIGRTQDLEEEQPTVEQELRKLMEKPERLKTTRDKKREEQLMAKLVKIVNDRNAIVDGLDDDRIREEEEDVELNKMMTTFSIKKDKPKKSPMSKLFSWGGRKDY
ncbi:MICAL-like protein 2 isoform X2 [Gouania willdenowi]|nr:MICAL-like protein 2 isoform X2 [Gouania willdenowi]